jgi:hypothetical protein
MGLTYQLAVLAELALNAGDTQTANEHISRAVAHAEMSGERFWLPRVLCLRAMISRRLGLSSELIEVDLNDAILRSAKHGVAMFELEARLEYEKLWQPEGPAGNGKSGLEPLLSRMDGESLIRALGAVRSANLKHSAVVAEA